MRYCAVHANDDGDAGHDRRIMIGKNSELPTERVDERDTMFARMARRAGTTAYEHTYARWPERRRGDDRIRAQPRLCREGGRYYDEVISAEALSWFDRIDHIAPDREQVERLAARLAAGPNPTEVLKELTCELGAVAVGCTQLDEAFIYSHKGRFDEDYGRPVALDHGWVLVFLVEMDFAAMQAAPGAKAIRETAREYYAAARIAMVAAAAIEAAGYAARAHYDAHYDVLLPPLAVRAGLGELGRNNILIADRYGSRVRIGAVTTTLPLRADPPRSLGAHRFCAICKKCADNCPSNALSRGELVSIRGVARWPTHVERCYGYWRNVGTDCGICMAVCPFSHRNSGFHNAIRAAVRRLPVLHRALLWCDHAVYGRRWKLP